MKDFSDRHSEALINRAKLQLRGITCEGSIEPFHPRDEQPCPFTENKTKRWRLHEKGSVSKWLVCTVVSKGHRFSLSFFFFFFLLATFLRLTCDLLATFLRLTCDFLATYLRLFYDLAARLPS